MVCEQCQQRKATVHLTRIINGEKTESHLCEMCAAESGDMGWMMESTFSIHSLLGGLLDVEQGTLKRKETRCSHCGQSYRDFTERGLFGCSSCYETFSSQIPPLLRRVQGTMEHRGKVPVRAEGMVKVKRQLEQLRRELEEAVINEEYELAAKLRDHLKTLEKQVEGEK